jgi:hypothetical protein
MTADHTGMFGEAAFDPLFEFPDAQHLGEDPDLPFGVGCLHAHLIPLDCLANGTALVRMSRPVDASSGLRGYVRKFSRSNAIENRALGVLDAPARAQSIMSEQGTDPARCARTRRLRSSLRE